MHKRKIEKQIRDKRKENNAIFKMKKEKSHEKLNLMGIKRQHLAQDWKQKISDLDFKNNQKNDLKIDLSN